MKKVKRTRTARLSTIQIVDGKRMWVYRLNIPLILIVNGRLVATLAVGVTSYKRGKTRVQSLFFVSCKNAHKRSGKLHTFRNESNEEIINWLGYKLK